MCEVPSRPGAVDTPKLGNRRRAAARCAWRVRGYAAITSAGRLGVSITGARGDRSRALLSWTSGPCPSFSAGT